MDKVLFVATVDSHIRHFHIPYLKYFKENGYEVHVATSNDENEVFNYCDFKHTIIMERSPLRFNNIKAIKQMTSLIQKEKFDIITCHTPMGSVITRLAVRKLRKKYSSAKRAQQGFNDDSWSPDKMMVIYTAHGFHFYNGAPFINWLVYFPIEKWLSKYTDKLITINKEDYDLAINKNFKAKKIYKIDGIGVDASKFNFNMSEDDKKKLKRELSAIDEEYKINKGDIIITYVAELISRKNQELIINVMHDLLSSDVSSPKNIKLLLVGTGTNYDKYKKLIKKLNLQSNILLTGYRSDVPKILKISDIVVSCAKQEGLPFNIIEAQMSGLPCVVSNCRGNTELIEENQTGFIINIKNKNCIKNYSKKLLKLINSASMRNRMGNNALENSKKYKLSRVLDEMNKIYKDD